MKEMGMMSEHINYLQRYEIIFVVCGVSLIISVVFFYIYVSFYVDGTLFAKYAVYISYALIVSNILFFNSLITIFYLAIQIKFSLLNEHFE